MPNGISMARAARLARKAPQSCTAAARVNDLGRLHAELAVDVDEAHLKPGKTQDVLVAIYELGSVGEDGHPQPIPISRHRALAFPVSVCPQEGEPEACVSVYAELPNHAGMWVELALERKKPRRAPVLLGALALICALIAYLIGSWADPNARRGYYEGKTREEIQRDLDAEVDWCAMEISVAPRVLMSAGSRACALRVENLAANHCDQKVRVWEQGYPNDVLFESGAIAPGEYLQVVELTHPLPIGTHTLIVQFQGYERQPTLISNEGALLGHNSFGASCAAEVQAEVVATN
ncbi:MAG: hypothetical protein Q4B54_07040 [Coriobacteriales bacterium]|nr:hypothetical protein [Coriobacteriales bacterium]